MPLVLDKHLNRPWAVMVLILAAYHSTCRWVVVRLTDGTEPLTAIMPWFFLLLFRLTSRHKEEDCRITSRDLTAAGMLMLAGGLLSPILPPLVTAVWFGVVLSIPFSRTICGRSFHLGITGLLFAALPVISSMQFFLGYPLRVIVTRSAAVLLSGCGYQVMARGVTLVWHDVPVVVDAPCSGVHMLWTGAVAVSLLALLLKLDNRRTLFLGLVALPIIIAGNILRATTLFLIESRQIVMFQGGVWHSGIGLVAFALVLVAIFACSIRLRRKDHAVG